MIILALDLGTTTGWALFKDDVCIASGEWDCSPLLGRGERWKRFQKELRKHIVWAQSFGETVVVYEKVMAHAGTSAAHIYGGFEAIVEWECFKRGVDLEHVAVKTVKKFATGNGNAKKPAMMQAAKDHWLLESVDENEADARWVGETYRAKSA